MRSAALGGIAAALLVAAVSAAGAAPADRDVVERRVKALAALGCKIFADPALSASGKLSCASCHSPRRAFGPPNALAVQSGGKDLRQPGLRAVPSLRYLQAAPAFSEHYYESEDDGDESVDNGPTGGLTWDGRADRGRDQAMFPLLSPFEMANAGSAGFAARLQRAPYAGEVRRWFGAAVFADPRRAAAAAGEALEAYQQNWRDFYPYSSKYDAWLAGRAELTESEHRGLDLFENPAKGNCARCHPSRRGKDGTPPQFTDYGLVALGVPRNRAIPANRDPGYYDLGLCGPLRTDFHDRDEYCGRFMTPTLRNVATRGVFFHNGAVRSLRAAVAFYAERDTLPGKWYPHDAAGRIDKFDDLPARYRANIETEPPFGGQPGDAPPLSAAEIDNIAAFLATLTDGYRQPR